MQVFLPGHGSGRFGSAFGLPKTLVLLMAVLFLSAAPSLLAAGRADQIVSGLSAAFRAMPSYRVDFEVTMGEHRMTGNYAVCGESYRLVLGDAEVWSDGKTRYEVDNRRKEVTLAGVDPNDRNILNNPVRAFDFLGSDYAALLLREQEGEATLSLEPAKGSGAPTGRVTLVVATQTMRPRSLDYEFDGERVTVRILGIEPLHGTFPAFDRTAYAAYEWIDFR